MNQQRITELRECIDRTLGAGKADKGLDEALDEIADAIADARRRLRLEPDPRMERPTPPAPGHIDFEGDTFRNIQTRNRLAAGGQP